MNVEVRLQDALDAYRAQVTVSPDLLGRIETRVERRPAWPNPRVLRPVAIALVVIAMIAVSIAVLRSTTSGDGGSAAAHQRTVAGADRTCDALTSGIAGARIVFETPTAYASVAATRADLARAAAARLRRINASAADRSNLTSAIAHFGAAADQAERARAAAQGGDLAAARGEFDGFDGAIARARDDLVAMGATRCQPEG